MANPTSFPNGIRVSQIEEKQIEDVTRIAVVDEDNILKYWVDKDEFTQSSRIEIVNIVDYGAVGDGVTESAQFIQDALDYAETNGIRRVYAPAGEYLLEKTVYIPTEIEFYGDGMDKTIFKIDAETVLDTIGMFTGSTHHWNFYTPVISTKTTRTGATLNNILLKDFKIDDIYYDDTGLVSQVCPMLILNTKNSNIENVEFGNVQTEEEQDGISRLSLGVSIVFSENILLDRCVHGFAGYESLSIRFLSYNIVSRQNVFNINKPANLNNQNHCTQVARPTPLIGYLNDNYGKTICEHYTSEGDTFNMIGGVDHAITAHTSNYIKIINATVNSLGVDATTRWGFKIFDNSNFVTIVGNTINLLEPNEVFSGSLYNLSVIGIGSTTLNDSSRDISNYVVSGNIINLELNRNISSLVERDVTPIIGNLRTQFHNVTITDNVVNITGTGTDRKQAVFGFYGTNIIASGNVVNFDGEASESMRAFVVEGGDRINVVNNAAFGEHAYSLKVNNVESLENLIIGANNFSSITLNNREVKTEVIAYKSDISSILIPINLFIQHSDSSVLGDSGTNLIQPDLGLPILEVDDLQENSSYSGELVLNIENNNIATTKVIELFGAEIYNNTNPSADITAKVTFTLNFFNQVGDDIDYKLSWQYVASGEVLFGEHTETIDRIDNHIFDLLVTGDSTDNFTLKQANLKRVTDSKSRAFTGEVISYNLEVKNAVYNNVDLGNKIPQFNTIKAIDEFISNLKTAGVWSKLDIFSLFQMNDNTLSDFALYDYKRGAFMTAFGGIGYTINGYKGNGIDGYINTNFNPATSGVNYTLNNASRGMYITSAPGSVQNDSITVDVSSNSPSSGSLNRTRIYDTNTTRINNTESLSSSIDLAGVGLKVINRDSLSNVRAYNNTDEYNVTATVDSINNATQLLLTSLSGYSDVGFGLYFMGASLTSQNVADLINHYNTYLRRIGL